MRKFCVVGECHALHHARGYCRKHYQRVKSNGTLGPVKGNRVWYRGENNRAFVMMRGGKGYLWSRLLMWNELGRELTRREVVHHINEDPTDDCVENLEVLAGQSEHSRLHREKERRLYCPRGHQMSGENLYIGPKNEHRCRRCQADHARRYRKERHLVDAQRSVVSALRAELEATR